MSDGRIPVGSGRGEEGPEKPRHRQLWPRDMSTSQAGWPGGGGGKNPLKLVIIGTRGTKRPWSMGRYERAMRATVREWHWRVRAHLLRPL